MADNKTLSLKRESLEVPESSPTGSQSPRIKREPNSDDDTRSIDSNQGGDSAAPRDVHDEFIASQLAHGTPPTKAAAREAKRSKANAKRKVAAKNHRQRIREQRGWQRRDEVAAERRDMAEAAAEKARRQSWVLDLEAGRHVFGAPVEATDSEHITTSIEKRDSKSAGRDKVVVVVSEDEE